MKKTKLVTSLALMSILVAGCSEKKEEGDALAQIGDIVITEEVFHEEMKQAIGEDTFKQMVLQRLLKTHYQITEDELEAAINKVKIEQGFHTDAELEKALLENEVTFEAFKENTEITLLLEKASMDGVVIPEKEMKAEYERVKHHIRARHILVKERSLAEDLYQQLQNGADFETLAQEHSIDTASSVNGGDLGFFGQDYMVDAFEQKAFRMHVGEISPPLQTAFGFHIIEVTEKNRSYDELKETLRETLTSQQKKTTDEVLADLLKEKDVSIYDDFLKNALHK